MGFEGEDVVERDDTLQATVAVDQWEATDARRLHDRKLSVWGGVFRCRGRRAGHDVAHEDVERVQAGGHHAQCQIPIREDPDGAIFTIHDDDAADAALLHALRRRASGFSDGGDVDFVAGGVRDGCHGTARGECRVPCGRRRAYPPRCVRGWAFVAHSVFAEYARI